MTTKPKLLRLEPIEFTPEALEALLNSQETDRYHWRVRRMTREEFKKLYPEIEKRYPLLP